MLYPISEFTGLPYFQRVDVLEAFGVVDPLFVTVIVKNLVEYTHNGLLYIVVMPDDVGVLLTVRLLGGIRSDFDRGQLQLVAVGVEKACEVGP